MAAQIKRLVRVLVPAPSPVSGNVQKQVRSAWSRQCSRSQHQPCNNLATRATREDQQRYTSLFKKLDSSSRSECQNVCLKPVKGLQAQAALFQGYRRHMFRKVDFLLERACQRQDLSVDWVPFPRPRLQQGNRADQRLL